jgi:glutathione S-transferase
MIIVHHLNNSRSQRVLWMLEEIGVPYEIKKYQRDATTNLAPPELTAVHPLGKSPVIEDDGKVIAESGAILEYLAWKSGKLGYAPGDKLWPDYIHWLHYAEGSAMLPGMLALYVGRLGEAGAPLQPRISSERANHYGYLNKSLEGKDFLVGNALSAADIQNSFALETAAMRGGLTEFPNLARVVTAWQARPAYRAALEKGGPYAFAR